MLEVKENEKPVLLFLLSPNMAYVYFLLIFCSIFILISAYFIRLKAEYVHAKQDQVHMEMELARIRMENDIREKDILSSVNLVEIKEKAIKELGMDYPDAKQIVYYEAGKGKEKDGVIMYREIPD